MKKIKKMLLSIMLMSIPMLTLAATGHIDGCTNTGTDTSCCQKKYTISAKTGYQVTNVLVNGTSKGAVTSVTLSSIKGPQSIKIVSQYTGPYTISFNANGGSGTMNPIAVANGAAVTLTANAFTRSQYTFQGWSTSASGSVTYNNSASVTPSAHLTLYAIWKYSPVSITCTYNAPNASGNASFIVNGTTYTGSATGLTSGCSVTVSKHYSSYNSATFNGTSVTLPYTFTATGNVTIRHTMAPVVTGTYMGQPVGYTSYTCTITTS